jgi:hypothetical protein
LQVGWKYWWTGELPKHDEAQVEGVDVEAAKRALAQESAR